MRATVLLVALALAACSHSGGGGYTPPPPEVQSSVPLGSMDPNAWEIGPIINGENISVNMPLHPAPHPQGWVLNLPLPPGSAHYITMPTGGPLTGKKAVTLRFRVETEGGAKIVPRDLPELTGMLTLYFERAGLCWTSACETARWYSVNGRVRPLVAGEYVLRAGFDEPWTGVLTTISTDNPNAFAETLRFAGRIGFVLGGGNGVGHGVHATGPARIVVTGFTVE